MVDAQDAAAGEQQRRLAERQACRRQEGRALRLQCRALRLAPLAAALAAGPARHTGVEVELREPTERRGDLVDQLLDGVLRARARRTINLTLEDAERVRLEARQQQRHQNLGLGRLPRCPQPQRRGLRLPPVIQGRLGLLPPCVAPLV